MNPILDGTTPNWLSGEFARRMGLMAKQKQEVRIFERSISLGVAQAEVDAVVSAVASLAPSEFEVWSEEQMRIEEQTMGVRRASYARPVEALDYDFDADRKGRADWWERSSGSGSVGAV